jgi:ribonucleoside-diphosphate reductase alpha chain
MQIASSSAVSTNYVNPADLTDANKSSALQTNLSNYQIIRRNGAVVPFEPAKIAVAMMKAF